MIKTQIPTTFVPCYRVLKAANEQMVLGELGKACGMDAPSFENSESFAAVSLAIASAEKT